MTERNKYVDSLAKNDRSDGFFPFGGGNAHSLSHLERAPSWSAEEYTKQLLTTIPPLTGASDNFLQRGTATLLQLRINGAFVDELVAPGNDFKSHVIIVRGVPRSHAEKLIARFATNL